MLVNVGGVDEYSEMLKVVSKRVTRYENKENAA